jgi:hypothetical protein
MKLSMARCLFTSCLADLIREIYKHPSGLYYVAFDEVTERLTEKDPTSDHMKGSLHHLGLAADLNLYIDDGGTLIYLGRTEDHMPFGIWWENYGIKLGYPLRWGGRFGDGNHYSWEWEGRK